MLADGKVSSRAAKDILALSIESPGKDPLEIAKKNGLLKANVDSQGLKSAIETVVKENQSVVVDYRNGKTTALEFLVGQSMKALRGAGDPKVIREMLKETIAS